MLPGAISRSLLEMGISAAQAPPVRHPLHHRQLHSVGFTLHAIGQGDRQSKRPRAGFRAAYLVVIIIESRHGKRETVGSLHAPAELGGHHFLGFERGAARQKRQAGEQVRGEFAVEARRCSHGARDCPPQGLLRRDAPGETRAGLPLGACVIVALELRAQRQVQGRRATRFHPERRRCTGEASCLRA